MHGLFLWGCGVVTGAGAMYTISAVLSWHYRRRNARAAREFMDGMRQHVIDTVKARFSAAGFAFGHPVEPEDIRVGDRIYHQSPDGVCITYTAGFHGDAGQQESGQWLRLEQ